MSCHFVLLPAFKKAFVVQILRTPWSDFSRALVVFARRLLVAETPAAGAQADAGGVAMAVGEDEAAALSSLGGLQSVLVPEPGGSVLAPPEEKVAQLAADLRAGFAEA